MGIKWKLAADEKKMDSCAKQTCESCKLAGDKGTEQM